MPTLNINTRVLAYGDVVNSSNPTKRYVDWTMSMPQVPVTNPASFPYTIAASATLSVFDSARTTGTGADTQCSIALSPLDPSRYRLSHTGVGTTPTFRTTRGMALDDEEVVIAVNANATATITVTDATPFGSVVAGDVVYIPGPTTGDAATVFSATNEGYWSVLTASAASITVIRFPGETFEATGESVTLTADSQFQIFTAAGIQVADILDISSGFTSSAWGQYDIVAVTPTSIDFLSTSPIGNETAVVGTEGVSAYASAKRYVRIEADQKCAVKINANTSSDYKIVPLIPGDEAYVGWYEQMGSVYKLSITNLSTVPANVMVFVAE